MNAGAGVAADALGIPAVAFSIGLEGYLVGRLHADAMAYHADCWISRHRSPPVDNPLIAKALLDPVPPTLHQPAGPPIHRVPIRPVPFSEAAAGGVPVWLTNPAARQRVYLTLGTVSFGAIEVLRYAVSEIAALDVDVLVAVGPDGDPAALGDVPTNVHVQRFVSQPEILPMMDLVIHHGGTGTVLAVLAAGLPQIILPQGADQFVNSDILGRIGAARTVPNDQHGRGAAELRPRTIGWKLRAGDRSAPADRNRRHARPQGCHSYAHEHRERLTSPLDAENSPRAMPIFGRHDAGTGSTR